ncbi:hypothetical protein M514_25094 [Trichuris suis]|uniref:Uncharacterized protein n=1 Tax=Trichuris suis TaxID=68888 RepID=A0A085MZR7_9BILA|nr:hypothetical protein M514_25094 [Trichuris suis]
MATTSVPVTKREGFGLVSRLCFRYLIKVNMAKAQKKTTKQTLRAMPNVLSVRSSASRDKQTIFEHGLLTAAQLTARHLTAAQLAAGTFDRSPFDRRAIEIQRKLYSADKKGFKWKAVCIGLLDYLSIVMKDRVMLMGILREFWPVGQMGGGQMAAAKCPVPNYFSVDKYYSKPVRSHLSRKFQPRRNAPRKDDLLSH